MVRNISLYLGVFYGLRGWQIAQSSDKWFRQGVIQSAIIFGISYAVMLLFWPWAQLHPLWHPFKALTVFSKFPILFINYFEGIYLKSTDLPWYYASKWILLTLPEFVLIGFLAGTSCLIVSYRKWIKLNMRVLQIALLMSSALFPLVYIAATDAALYDAIRHVLFVIPPLVVLGALGVDEAVKRLSNRRLRYGFSGVIGGAMLWTLWQMVILHPNEYLYFNHLFAGGLKTASERYETDYLNNSYRQGMRWVEAYARASERRLRLAAGTSAINFYLSASKFEYVEVPTQADLYLITTHHEGHRAVPGEVLHQIEADGVPILYVIRPDETFRDEPLFSKIRNPYRGMILGNLYQKTGRVVEAIQAYQEVTQHDPQFASPYVAIANLYFESERFDHALDYYNQALERMPFDPTVLTQKGDCLAKLNRVDEAIASYHQALFLRPYYLKALHNLAAVHFTEGRADVLKLMRTALWVWPESISGQQFLGWALIELGNMEEAERVYRALVEQTPDDPMAYYNLGILLQKQGQTGASIQAFQEAVNLDPENALRYADLGRMLADIGQKAEAMQAYRQSLRLNPDQPVVLRALETLESR
jgi:tetratricopeptide (TPR) repeat protein